MDNIIIQVNKNPKQFALTQPITRLVSFIEYATDKYYNDEEVISDITFDILWDTLGERDPSNKIFTTVGAPIRNDINKVELPYKMPSLAKIKPTKNTLDRWLSKFGSSNYHISEKLDGLSGMLVYKDGNVKLYTRGDGKVGQDISYLIPYLKGIPSVIDGELAVRGEFIMSNKVFDRKYKDIYPKIRSIVAGMINSKKPNKDILADIEFVVYEMVYPKLYNNSKSLEKLSKLKFIVVKNEVINSLSIEELSDKLIKYNIKSDYPIDGLVVGDNSKVYKVSDMARPDDKFAYKQDLEGQKRKTVVIGVNWKASKHGKLAPRVQFEPVLIGGDKIEYATGFHASYIMNNKVGAGAKITVIRSGDVIPYIYSVDEGANNADMPKMRWHWDETRTNIYLDMVETDDVAVSRLTHFFTTLNVKYLKEGIINKIVDNGYDTVSKIYNMTVDDLEDIDGIQSKLANKLYNAIHEVMSKEIELWRLMVASNVFGIGFGEKRIKELLSVYPDWKNIKYEDALKVDGYSDKMAKRVILGLVNFAKYMGENKELKVASRKIVSDKDKFMVVMSGTRDSSVQKFIENKGWVIVPSMTKNINLLIVKDKTSKTSKLEYAVKNKIPVVDIKELYEKYK